MKQILNFNLYTKSIIEELLKNYYDIKPFSDMHHLRMDLERALQSVKITGQMRELIFWRYAIGLSYVKTIKIMNIIEFDYLELEDEMMEVLEALMNGWHTDRIQFQKSKSDCLDGYLIELHTKHLNPFCFDKIDGIIEKLVELDDDLAKSALGLIEDKRGEYTDNDSGLPTCKAVAPTGHRKTASNDEFYRSDLRNNVFWGDESLMLAEISGCRI